MASLRDATRMDLMKAKSNMGRVIFRRAHHVITENERTLLACEALQKANWRLMGELMYSSHASLRDDYEVSSPELDAVVEIATGLGESKGMMGCRMTGAGFGGCTVSLVRTESVHSLTRRIQEDYEEKMDSQPTIFATRPAAGARVLKSAGK
jgi:galactokinase